MPDIQHAMQINAPPEAVYPLFASDNGFGKWWAADITEEDGVVSLGFFGRSTVYRLRLANTNPPSEAVWQCESGDEWNGTQIRFRVEPGNSGCALRFTHGNWREATDYFVNCNTTWGGLMYRLKAAAEGHNPGPLFSADGMGY